jgi:hypothetical protein
VTPDRSVDPWPGAIWLQVSPTPEACRIMPCKLPWGGYTYCWIYLLNLLSYAGSYILFLIGHIFLIHSSADGHLNWMHILTTDSINLLLALF